MFVVCPSTVWNAHALETRSLPKRYLGRVMLFPRRGMDAAGWARLIFEIQPLRFGASLVPFVIAMLVWPDLALPIAQAPLAMIVAIGVVELKVLHLSDAARAALVEEDEADRILDALRFRGSRILSRIAARRGMRQGVLRLVVEQSEMARVTPLTLISVQAEAPEPRVLDLDAEERALLHGLFDAELSEWQLLRVNLRHKSPVREVAFDARGVSAHARLAAVLERGPSSPLPA